MVFSPYSCHSKVIDYFLFDAYEIDSYPKGFVDRCIEDAKKEYSDSMAYHNWDHARAVIHGVEMIANKLNKKGIKTAKIP